MIRTGELLDCFRFSKLANEFHDELYPGDPYDRESFIRTWEGLLLSGRGFILVAESGLDPVGAIGFLVQRGITGEEMSAVELFWFVSKKYRGTTHGVRLLVEAERRLKEAGIGKIKMATVAGSTDASIGDVLVKLGYGPKEIFYEKKLYSN